MIRAGRAPRAAAALCAGALAVAAACAGPAAAAPPPHDGVVDLLTDASAEIAAPGPGALHVAGGGDVDGDGRGDLVVAGGPGGPPPERPWAGVAWIVPGRAIPLDVDLAAPGGAVAARIAGPSPGARAGLGGAAVVGDVNGDGLADVAIGAPGASARGRTAPGALFVVFGRRGLGDVDLADLGAAGLRADGPAVGSAVGVGVAPAGDVNGDGLADVLVGPVPAPRARGRTWLVFGRREPGEIDLAAPAGAAATVTGLPPSIPWVAHDGAADVDGDGLDDVVIGDPGGRGTLAHVVFGARGFSDLDLADPGPRAMRLAGGGSGATPVRVAGAGDLDGDGHADVAVAVPGGRVHVVAGRPERRDVDLTATPGRVTAFEPGPRGLFGIGVAGVGDVDGDGRPDLAIAVAGHDYPGRGDAGAVVLVRGRPGLLSAPVRRAGPEAGAVLVGPSAGAGVAAAAPAGDLDGDGRAEVALLGGRMPRAGAPDAAAAWIWGAGASRPCARVARPAGRGPEAVGGRRAPRSPVRLSAAQLLVNQRIGQAAVRRVAAAERRLAGLGGRDVCGGTVSAAKLVEGLAPVAAPPTPLRLAAPDPLRAPRAHGGQGRVTLSASQLRINQRIYRVALLRARGLADRLAGRVTGGDMAPGALDAGPRPRPGGGRGRPCRLGAPVVRPGARPAAPACRDGHAQRAPAPHQPAHRPGRRARRQRRRGGARARAHGIELRRRLDRLRRPRAGGDGRARPLRGAVRAGR